MAMQDTLFPRRPSARWAWKDVALGASLLLHLLTITLLAGAGAAYWQQLPRPAGDAGLEGGSFKGRRVLMEVGVMPHLQAQHR